jgi:hypothetical protein
MVHMMARNLGHTAENSGQDAVSYKTAEEPNTNE